MAELKVSKQNVPDMKIAFFKKMFPFLFIIINNNNNSPNVLLTVLATQEPFLSSYMRSKCFVLQE